MIRPNTPIKPLYPDVIGAVTGGPRVNMEDLEVALGVFPRRAYLNQPCEMVLVMQNMINQPVQVKAAIRLPSVDRNGDVVVIETPKSMVTLNLTPGEVGVLRMPVVARPPTAPGKDFPVRVAIRYRVKDKAKAIAVRPPGGGVPPSVLSVSEYKLQVLREVEYTIHKWNESAENMTVYFDVEPRTLPNTGETLKPHYEVLWAEPELRQEIELVKEFADDARELATTAAHGSAYLWFMDAVEERFAARDMPLHPGEVRAIAKIMTYAVDDALTREPDLVLENLRWYRALCQALARNPDLLNRDRNEIITRYTFEAVLYEAILLGFRILGSRVKEDLGTPQEQVEYANHVMTWFAGHGEADLSYVYLPLVLSGLIVNRWVRTQVTESPWDIIDELIEAYQGRKRLIAGATDTVFDMLDDLIANQSRVLKNQRIERPQR